MHRLLSKLSVLLCASAMAVGLMPGELAAQTAACSSPSEITRLTHPLRRFAQRLAARQPITIVAIGSSSTAGAGASSSAASYPSRLEVELKTRFPHIDIKVLNRGIGGEVAADMLGRFDKAVLAEQPDLVLWQVGTNTLLRHQNVAAVETLIHDGIERLKTSGADVVLINPQFAPKVTVEPDAPQMIRLISATAKAESVGVFHRFDVMRHWKEAQALAFDTFLSPDGLHMNDWSYACVAKLLAASLEDAATRATAVAGAVRGSPQRPPAP